MPFDKTLSTRLTRLRVRNSPDDVSYLKTYKIFLDFFKTRIAVKDPDLSDLKIAVVLVYTWMGRARLDPACWNNFVRARDALMNIRVAALDAPAVEAIKSFVGSSLVATSKFLHFFDPDKYAIWDSNVALAAYGLERHYQYDRIDLYLDYLVDLHKMQLPESTRRQVKDILGADVSRLRAKEFALFHLGISENTKTKAKRSRA